MSTRTKGPQPFLKLHEDINEEWVRQDRDFGVPTRTELSVTGQRYVTLVADTPYLDRGMAFLAGRGIFDSYARNRIGNLYWRMSPMIERIKHDDGGSGYRVQMKLLISDNPVVPRLAAEAMREPIECL